MPCKHCGREEGGRHFCWPSYCIEKLGRDCQLCTNNCLFVRNKGKTEKREGKIVVEELDG